MAKLNIQLEGVLNFVPADINGDYFNNKAKRKIVIWNQGMEPVDVTVVAQKECQLGHLHDRTFTVGADESFLIPELNDQFYVDEEGNTYLEYTTAGDISLIGVAVVDA